MIVSKTIFKENASIWKNRYSNPSQNYYKSQDILKKAYEIKDQKGSAYAKINMAMACFLQSKNKEAHNLLSQIVEYFYENRDEQGYLWMLNLQASLFESIGDYEKGLSIALKAIKHAEERGEYESEAEIASILGLIYSRLCNFEKSIHYYTVAKDIREAENDIAGLASTLNRIGMVCRLTGDYEKALGYYLQSLSIRQKNNLNSALPWTMLGIASTYEDMGKHNEALAHYQKGLINSDKRCALQCEMGIGRIQIAQGEKEKAEKTLSNAILIAEELQANALIADIYLSLSTLYETINNPAKAYETYKKYQSVKEAVLNEEAKNRLQNIEISHAIEKSEREKEIFRLRNVELKAAYDTIEEKNKEITSSISYARYIQEAILPQPQEVSWLENRMFILYLPKDIVSGDFYWFTEKDEKMVVVAADCTGHGVPGALMSMLGVSLLEEIVNKRGIMNADEILNNLRHEVIRSLNQKGVDSKSKDGMDISLVVIDTRTTEAQYAGAYNSLYKIQNGNLIEYKADKMPIAIHHRMDSQFTKHSFDIKTNDMLYLCSDGFQDQFGGIKGKKFMTKNLKTLFTEISHLELPEQKEILYNRYNEWKDNYEQIDDVVIVGIKI